MSILIKNGHLIDPKNDVNGKHDIYIVDGKIAALDKAPKGFKAEQTIDASGKTVIPGIVDLSARLREPGQEHKGTIASETRAAAASGVTTLCVPPDTNPIIDNPAVAGTRRVPPICRSFACLWFGPASQGVPSRGALRQRSLSIDQPDPASIEASK